MRRNGYSVQVVHDNGYAAPIGHRNKQRDAIKLAREVEQVLGRETRVWDVRAARCVYPCKAVAL